MKMNERRSKPSTVRLHTQWTVIRCLSTPHCKVGELQLQLIPFLPVFLLPSLPTSTLSLWCMLLVSHPYGVHSGVVCVVRWGGLGESGCAGVCDLGARIVWLPATSLAPAAWIEPWIGLWRGLET